jgi:hypothetical protein
VISHYHPSSTANMPPSSMHAKRRLQAISQQLVEGIPDAGKFEDIPKIRRVAGDSAGPYVPSVTRTRTKTNCVYIAVVLYSNTD